MGEYIRLQDLAAKNQAHCERRKTAWGIDEVASPRSAGMLDKDVYDAMNCQNNVRMFLKHTDYLFPRFCKKQGLSSDEWKVIGVMNPSHSREGDMKQGNKITHYNCTVPNNPETPHRGH